MPQPFVEQALACATPNRLNRLHIDCEIAATPAEIAAIARDADRLPEPSRAWLARLDSMAPGLLRDPQPFRRQTLSPRMELLQGASSAQGRNLLIGFCGVADRFMVPLPVFLQRFEARAWDILRITHGGARGAPRRPYLGAETARQDAADLALLIRGAVDLRPYRRIVCFGTSSGGYAALVTALWLGADLGVAFGAAAPADAAPPLPRRARVAALRPRLVNHHAADNAEDSRNALVLQARMGVTLRPVPGVAHHNILQPYGDRSRIADLLPSAVDPDQVAPARACLLGWLRRRGAA